MSKSSFFFFLCATWVVIAARGLAAQTNTDRHEASVTLHFDQAKTRIAPEIYGQFTEHLGHCIYGGIWVGEDSPIPNTRGIRNDVVAALKNMQVPVVRWPGGCFADEYHWRNGIGPRDKRPKMINTHWGGVVEDNSFGTHEFMDFCQQVGCEPYICGNLGSGTVQEMMEWVEYMTSDADSPLANLRRQNGRDKPWKLKYFAVGNESWGCGGNMTPEFYSNEFRRYNTFIKDYPGNKIYRVAGGPNSTDYNWTDVLMKNVGNKMQGLSLHYYTLPTGNWQHKGSATHFDEAAYHATLVNAFKMEDMLKKHSEIMDKYDPNKRIGLVVDEWGNWYDVEPGTNPGFLYQQNTLRDALTAAVNLDLFQAHADRISMANIAQMINVLQSMILTDKEMMVLTPTYHVFEMYKGHQGATLIPLEVKSPDYELDGKSVPAVHATASQTSEGKVHISLVNLDANHPAHIEAKIPSGSSLVSARILTADTLDAHNTFDKPDAVKPAKFDGAKIDSNTLAADLPSKSIVVVELQKPTATAQSSNSGATSATAKEDTVKHANLAPVATPTTSFVSGDQAISAINDGVNPTNRSKQHYGNWPRGGIQWVEYTWSRPISTNKVDVYWYVDGRGLHLPQACRVKYYDGDKFVEVPNANGLGVERGQWNVTTFDEVTTTKIRLEFEAEGGPQISTGISQFRVFDSGRSPKFPPIVKAGPDRVVMLGTKTFLNGTSRAIDDRDESKITWSKTSGPGKVTFDDPNSADTRAAFSALGDYTLALTASLGDLTSSDALHVHVEAPAAAAHLEPVYTTHYKLDSPLWNSRAKALIVHWIPHCYTEISDLNLKEGGIANLIEAGKKLRGEPAKFHVGYPFSNAWIYNTLESMCIAEMVDPNGDQEMIDAQKAIRAKIDEWIPIILAAQEPDGYLQTRFTLGTARDNGNTPAHWSPRGRGEHEGYVAGYFLEAAISHYLMTDGKDRRLYDAAKRLADCWCDNIGPPPKKAWYDGHQEMEQALVRFARMVDHVEGVGKGDKYTQLAKFLIDSRQGGSPYDQSQAPAIEQYQAVGHAVRAGYFYSGMADIAMMTHDLDYQSAVCSICDDLVNRKLYITGGIGSGETSEGFGPDYSLRNNAYCESCSGTAVLFFNYKLNLTYQDAKYADLYEQTLYNAILGDIDLEGNNFCYTNELETSGSPDPRYPKQPAAVPSGNEYENYHAPLIGYRYPWHVCPCCVGNIPRTLLMLPTWMYATSPDSLYVNLFIGSTVDVPNIAGTNVQMVQATNYPWDGKVAITVKPEQSKNFSIRVRIPNRSTSELYQATPAQSGLLSLKLNGSEIDPEIDHGYAVITRQWKAGDKIELELPMKPQRVKAIDKVAADRGLVAVKYGPLVYDFEAADNSSMGPRTLPTLKSDSPLTIQWKPDLLEGVVVVKAEAPDGSPLVAIPNYARNNRSGHSAVWVQDEGNQATAGN